MAMVDLTLKKVAALDLERKHLCIVYPNLDVNFELKSRLIHMLPIFRYLARKNLNKYLKEFHIVYSSMKLVGIT